VKTSVLLCFVSAMSVLPVAAQTAAPAKLPYDHACPVIYDNDGVIESGYTDVYIMALASAKIIQLKGIITTCSYGEEQRTPRFSATPEDELVRERQELIEKARRSGLRNLPDATAGPSLSLKRPASRRVEDTVPYGTPGSWLIVKEARKATPTKPLVVVMGGQGTCVADAYLMDPSIADKMVLAWNVGNKNSSGDVDYYSYNLGVDPWATYIAFERLRVVAFPYTHDDNHADDGFAATPKSRLGELPDTELRQTMREAAWPRGGGTVSEPTVDIDVTGAIALTRLDYVLNTKRVSFGRWEPDPWGEGKQVPYFKQDPEGRVLVVWESNAAVATEEWWRRVQAPAAWAHSAGQIPFRGAPWKLPGTIEAEHFDHGGEGQAYHDTTNNFTEEGWLNPIRCLEQADIAASRRAGGGHAVSRTQPGEWMAYTVTVERAGVYALGARVASAGGGTFHIEVDGVDKTGPLAVPDTGAQDSWQDISHDHIFLSAGRHVLRVVMDSASPHGHVGDFDSLRVTQTEHAAESRKAKP